MGANTATFTASRDRRTHSYLGLLPGLDFERRIYAKINADELLERELSKPNYQAEPIALGVNTDAYQPVEPDLKLTRRVIGNPEGVRAFVRGDYEVIADRA